MTEWPVETLNCNNNKSKQQQINSNKSTRIKRI